uniref:Uncharacterized protein n=1 Tax=viral metagenome TaxID=1070528 RepID=A0A6M3XW46_9ZZZZ
MFTGKSADELEKIAFQANKLSDDLRRNEPSYALALSNGVRDCSYHTQRCGMVAEYKGTAIIKMANGKMWRAVGHGPCGTAETVTRDGWIEFIPIADWAKCSVCGSECEGIEDTGADWYLCDKCEGTELAIEAGYTHNAAEKRSI